MLSEPLEYCETEMLELLDMEGSSYCDVKKEAILLFDCRCGDMPFSG